METPTDRTLQASAFPGDAMRPFLQTLLIVLATLELTNPVTAQEKITLSIRDVLQRPALHFPALGKKGSVLVHQSGWSADSWTPLAERLQQHGVSSVSLVFASSDDVLAAVEFLRANGSEDITLIGASIGGGAALQALRRDAQQRISNVILLGTSEGDSSEAVGIPKLFVVSENDFFAGRTHASYAKASSPKRLILYPGSAHGQEMLDAPYGESLVAEILATIVAG